MKYMLMVYEDETRLTDEIQETCRIEASQICHELARAGKFIAASPLQPTSLATSVRVREGKRLVTDGPFAETREQLGGFFGGEHGGAVHGGCSGKEWRLCSRTPTSRVRLRRAR